MAIRPVRLFGDPILRTVADPVTDFDKQLRNLVKDLTQTLDDAQGAGLAAPQASAPRSSPKRDSPSHPLAYLPRRRLIGWVPLGPR